MYTRTVTAICKPGKQEEAIELWKRHMAPVFKYFRGCQAGYLFTNPETRQYLSLSFWKTQTDAEAVQISGAYTKLLHCFHDVFEDPPVVTIYELNHHVFPLETDKSTSPEPFSQ